MDRRPPRRIGTLQHNICSHVPQIFYDIGNLTTALEKRILWAFNCWRGEAWWAKQCNGQPRASFLPWKQLWRRSGAVKEVLKRQNMTLGLCWTQVEANRNGSHDFQRKIKKWLFHFITFLVNNFPPKSMEVSIKCRRWSKAFTEEWKDGRLLSWLLCYCYCCVIVNCYHVCCVIVGSGGGGKNRLD